MGRALLFSSQRHRQLQWVEVLTSKVSQKVNALSTVNLEGDRHGLFNHRMHPWEEHCPCHHSRHLTWDKMWVVSVFSMLSRVALSIVHFHKCSYWNKTLGISCQGKPDASTESASTSISPNMQYRAPAHTWNNDFQINI